MWTYSIDFQEYEDGEVLVEHEPIRYELRDIKKDKWRTSYGRDLRVLGSTILANSNDPERSNTVETVISYTYDKINYWGTIEGVARGLPTEVYENPKLPPVNLGPTGWGFKINETKTEVRMRRGILYFERSYFCHFNISLHLFVHRWKRWVPTWNRAHQWMLHYMETIRKWKDRTRQSWNHTMRIQLKRKPETLKES